MATLWHTVVKLVKMSCLSPSFSRTSHIAWMNHDPPVRFLKDTYPASSDKFRLVQTSSDKFRQVQTSSDKFRQVQTSSDKFRQVQTSSDKFRQLQTTSDKFRQVQTRQSKDKSMDCTWGCAVCHKKVGMGRNFDCSWR